MAWRRVGGKQGGDFRKWMVKGQELVGIFRGFRDGKFGPLGVLEEEGREVVFPCHTALEDRLREVGEGDLVRITYEGYATSASGRQYKSFLVEVDEDHPADFPPPNAPEEGEPEYVTLPFPDEEGQR